MNIEFSEDEGIYYSHLRLESLQDFENISPPKALITADFGTDEAPSEAQKSALQYIIEHEQGLFAGLIQGIIKGYNTTILDLYGREDYMPEILTPDAVKKTVTIDDIIISDKASEGYAYVMFRGECDWDEEHGFCIVMHKDQFVKIGTWDLYY